jgi:CRP-like cAMP-binding protein
MPDLAGPFHNRILRGLSGSEQAAIVPHLQFENLPLGKILRRRGQIDGLVYFIESGMASAVAISSEGESIEVGLIGRYGVVGISSLLGYRGLLHETLMQSKGSGYSIEAGIVRAEFLKNGPLAHVIRDFTYALYMQAVQSALCLRAHGMEPRLARWLLTTSDILETETLHLTQDILSQMIGAARPSVAIAAGLLKNAGLIEYSRGVVKIPDRSSLEEASCECYGLLRNELKDIFDQNGPNVM